MTEPRELMQTAIGYQTLRDVDPIAGACRGLWAAVLQTAIEDAQGDVRAIKLGDVRDVSRRTGTAGGHRRMVRQMLVSEARAWLWSDAGGARSFVWVCSMLDLDPDVVRARLKVPSLGAED